MSGTALPLRVSVADDGDSRRDRCKAPQHCPHDLPFEEAWARFVHSMGAHHGIDVPEGLKPRGPGAESAGTSA